MCWVGPALSALGQAQNHRHTLPAGSKARSGVVSEIETSFPLKKSSFQVIFYVIPGME